MHTRNILFLSLILMVIYTAGYAHNETGSPIRIIRILLVCRRLKPKRQTVITNLHLLDKPESPA